VTCADARSVAREPERVEPLPDPGQAAVLACARLPLLGRVAAKAERHGHLVGARVLGRLVQLALRRDGLGPVARAGLRCDGVRERSQPVEQLCARGAARRGELLALVPREEAQPDCDELAPWLGDLLPLDLVMDVVPPHELLQRAAILRFHGVKIRTTAIARAGGCSLTVVSTPLRAAAALALVLCAACVHDRTAYAAPEPAGPAGVSGEAAARVLVLIVPDADPRIAPPWLDRADKGADAVDAALRDAGFRTTREVLARWTARVTVRCPVRGEDFSIVIDDARHKVLDRFDLNGRDWGPAELAELGRTVRQRLERSEAIAALAGVVPKRAEPAAAAAVEPGGARVDGPTAGLAKRRPAVLDSAAPSPRRCSRCSRIRRAPRARRPRAHPERWC
jgi:hypothetical protein